jgi:uncharacterized protein
MTLVGPVAQAERINSLDALRGFALLGILVMNVLVFGLYLPAGNNPTIAGGATGLNLACWALARILVVGKMRCLFSMVFGASAILLTSRAEERSESGAADIYYRRNLWLLLFGLTHAFLLFWGDILYTYALCGLILYPFRKLPAKRLLIIGGLLIVFQTVWSAVGVFRLADMQSLAAAAEAAVKTGKAPTEEQTEAKKELDVLRKRRNPSPQDLERDAKPWRGNPLEVIGARAKAVAPWHALPYYDQTNLDAWSMMFIGMGLFKLGVFSATRSYLLYAWIAVIGFLAGIGVNSYTVWLALRTNFDPVITRFTRVVFDIERLSVALAYMALLMILCKAGRLKWLTKRLAAVGQMALSNYIFQSVVCSFVFTGYGFGLYGRLERYQLYYVVAVCWVVSLIGSSVWLRHYRFGPLEWCWRSLTYWKRQPMRSRQPQQGVAAAITAA